MIQNCNQKSFIEFKSCRELFRHLPYTINKLEENRRPVSVGMVFITMTYSRCKFMSETYPFFLHQYFKALDAPIEAVQHQHGQGRQLGGPVPPVAAVHEHRALPWGNFVCDLNGSRQNKLARKNTRLVGNRWAVFKSGWTISHCLVRDAVSGAPQILTALQRSCLTVVFTYSR